MRLLKLKRVTTFVVLFLLCTFQTLFAQNRTVSGTLTDNTGKGVPGVTVTVKGTKTATQTDGNGTYRLSAPDNATLVFSSVGFETMEMSTAGKTAGVPFDAALTATNSNLSEVVVIGYGTARRRDLTGSFAAVSSRNFNQVPSATPDQLLQGKVAGLQITVANGQPGGATTVKIRGNNSIRASTNPLYVVDGVPLDGRSARPSLGINLDGGNNPQNPTADANPFTFLNPAEIESIVVLKDASASAIYGSRGANGVVLITTRSGSSGPLKIEVGASASANMLVRQADVLSSSEYRTALAKYGAASDSGASYTPFDKILQHRITQNYSLAISGGSSENGRYRASFLASSTPGIIRKSKLDKYIAGFNGNYKFLNQKLSFAYGIIAATTNETNSPISNNAGSTGNLISLAMQWNPTLLMQHTDGSYTINRNGQTNPLMISEAYNDVANVSTILANITAGYKIIPSLEYRLAYGANYSSGVRKNELQGWITGTGGSADGKGIANVAGAQLFSQNVTHTLTYTKKVNTIDFTVLGGYEFFRTLYKTQRTSVSQFDYNLNYRNLIAVHYYDNLQDGNQANLKTATTNDPRVDIQSYFTRVQVNINNKYSFSGSFRADGSSKFGANHKYAYFPAIAAKWSLSEEEFMKGSTLFNNLGVRIGYGQTGNQEFPAGAALDRYRYNSYGSLGVVNFANPDLKWETVSSTNAGVDFGFFKGKLTGSIDVFFKKTKDPLFPATLPAPAPSGTVYKNLDGYVSNKGGEIVLNANMINRKDLIWDLSVNATYVRNKFVYPAGGSAPLVLTGQLNGKGTSDTYVQAIANGQPIDVFYLRTFSGFDQNGFAVATPTASYVGDPNPHYYAGLTSSLSIKKLTVQLSMHGAFDYVIYNNTLQSVTGLGFINNGSNISKQLIGTSENVANPVSASTRYLQKGDFVKLSSLTARYNFGNIKSTFKNVSAFLSGSNLFVITGYKGFDPEVNVAKDDRNGTGIPSVGIDYIGYPSVRTFTVGINFSLN